MSIGIQHLNMPFPELNFISNNTLNIYTELETGLYLKRKH